ncbi:MAG: hypothetical protein QW835_00085 [Candidatus Hadarchaeum sp.]
MEEHLKGIAELFNRVLEAIRLMDQKMYALEVAVTELVEAMERHGFFTKEEFLQAARVRAAYGNFNYLLRSAGSLDKTNAKEKIAEVLRSFANDNVKIDLEKTILPQLLKSIFGKKANNLFKELKSSFEKFFQTEG